MTLRSPVESAHDSASRVGVRERLDLASAPASRRRARLSLSAPANRRGTRFLLGSALWLRWGSALQFHWGSALCLRWGSAPEVRARLGVRALATMGVRAPAPLGVRALPAPGVRAPCRTVAEVLGERLLTSFLWAPQGGSAGRFPLANRRCMRSAHKPAFPAGGCHGTQAGPLGRRLPALCKAPANRRRMRSAHKRPWRQAVATAHKPALPAGGCHLLSVRDPAAGGGCQRTLVHAAV